MSATVGPWTGSAGAWAKPGGNRPRPGPDPDLFGRHRSKPAGREMNPHIGQPMATRQPHRGGLSKLPGHRNGADPTVALHPPLPGSAPHHGCGFSVARTQHDWLIVMFPPFASCYPVVDGAEAWRQLQSNKLRMLTFWRDASERRLAALNAAISTLEQQIARDQPVQGS